MNIYSGTSGFAYREWLEIFYPPGLSSAAMLPFYAGKLPAVEINSTFYRMPRGEKLVKWGTQVPQEFRFAFKAPAVITHRLRLRAAEKPLGHFLEATAVLGARRGPLLFQLPPNFTCDLPLLGKFLSLLGGIPAVFEFRHASWFEENVYRTLTDAGCVLCASDREESPAPPVVPTGPFGYFRLRRGTYSHEDLTRWLKVAARHDWQEVFFFFRHEETGCGPRYAQELLDLHRNSPAD